MDRALLAPGDEAELERFLVVHADSSMFLRGNARAAGLIDRGERLQGTYVAARAAGAVVAVAACFWNGNVIVQGAVDVVGDLACDAVARSGRAVRGINGPYAQVAAARAALGLADRRATLDSREDLLALSLDALRAPSALAEGLVVCRRARPDERELLARWRYAYEVEALGFADSAEREAQVVAAFTIGSAHWVLVRGDELVATSGFNAELHDIVQVGGVYTPPAQRNRGYARAVVAGSLIDARARGATRSVLFVSDVAARSAYFALGYEHVGEYGLVLFEP